MNSMNNLDFAASCASSAVRVLNKPVHPMATGGTFFSSSKLVIGDTEIDLGRLAKRFLSFVRFDPSGCWIWNGGRGHFGHGRFHLTTRKPYKIVAAHRLAYWMHNGPIQAGLIVCHRCDNPQCVNPNHLFLGTHKDNADDMRAKGRARYGCNGKLNIAKVQDIKRRLAAGDRHKDIAADHAISDQTVWLISSGRLWRSVTINQQTAGVCQNG